MRALALERDRDGELRNAVQEIGGAVERIDDPGVGLVGALALAAFLAEKAVAGPRLGQFGIQRLLGAAVGGGDEIGRALERDLQVLDLAEVALERARGLARGGDHDVEQGGVEHGARGLPARGSAVKSAARGDARSTATSWLAFSAASRTVRRLLGGEHVELGIAGAAGLGDDVPFDRLGRIGRHAAPGHQNARQPVLRDRAAAARRLRAAAWRRRFRPSSVPLPLNCGDGEFDHGVEIAGDRRPAPSAAWPAAMSFGTPRPSLYMVASAYCASGLPAIGGGAEQFGGALEILRELLALQIEQAEIVFGGRMAELGGVARAAGRLRPDCAGRRGLRN